MECVEIGYDKLGIILDNNPTHKQKMQSQLAAHLQQMGLAKSITVESLYLPSYSPKRSPTRNSIPRLRRALAFRELNLVEYVIHLARLKFLHHLPMGTTLEQIEQKLLQFLDSNQFLSAQQVQNTLNFIFSLVA